METDSYTVARLCGPNLLKALQTMFRTFGTPGEPLCHALKRGRSEHSRSSLTTETTVEFPAALALPTRRCAARSMRDTRLTDGAKLRQTLSRAPKRRRLIKHSHNPDRPLY